MTSLIEEESVGYPLSLWSHRLWHPEKLTEQTLLSMGCGTGGLKVHLEAASGPKSRPQVAFTTKIV